MTREPDRFDKQARERAEVLLHCLGVNATEQSLHVAMHTLRAAESEALERAAQVAKQSQEDCFCKDKSDELLGGMPCAACMEAARIEGTLRGLADRAMRPDSADLLTKNKAADAIAAALRAERGDALDEAAKYVESFRSGAPSVIAAGIRALKPSAAAPAAESGKECRCPASDRELQSRGLLLRHVKACPLRTALDAPVPAPAQGAEARDAEWIEALRLYGVYLDGGRIWQNPPSGHSYDLKLKRLLAAHAAPQSGEGK